MLMSGDSQPQTTPLALAVELYGGLVYVLIPAGSPVPITVPATFETDADDQTEERVRIMRGDRLLSKDNTEIGNFLVTGIPAAVRGQSGWTTVFHLDADFVLTVTVTPTPGNASQSFKIASPFDLPDSEVKREKAEAAAMREADEKEAKRVHAKNELYFQCCDNRDDGKFGKICKLTLQWLEKHPDADIATLKQQADRLFD